ncbi:MAG TPA: DoxX family protein [Rhabdochlamydiaceae bacterium]|jgi:putative oxidoreductase|nr:DoxX family protein [Rhabdochlamydiaceae bacterium]
MTVFENILILIARICIGSSFLWAGAAKVFHWKSSAEYMRSKQMPTSLLPAAVLLQIVGGLSVLLGFEARIGTLLLIVFVIPTAVKMHDFWNLQDPDKETQKIMFMKDVMVLGGLLLLLATGAGSFAFN